MPGDPTAGTAETLAEGDTHYERRAEGAQGSRARPAEIDAAIAAYRRALAADKTSLEARWKLERALFFRASFCGAGEEERKPLLDEAKRVGDEGLARLEARIGSKAGPERIAALEAVPQAPQIYFWTAVSWG